MSVHEEANPGPVHPSMEDSEEAIENLRQTEEDQARAALDQAITGGHSSTQGGVSYETGPASDSIPNPTDSEISTHDLRGTGIATEPLPGDENLLP
ncbi:MAG: hypothetical protein KY468_06410 [Armatimonadetes bacterium]|nr:hypothetical protein [Armatimonadota bacterium]